jgi:thiol:disulfide interchange protein DsbD
MHKIFPITRLVLYGLVVCQGMLPVGHAAGVLHVQADLLAGGSAGAPPGSLWVGVHLRHEPGWHTYWKNPGDAGVPTQITWQLPAGWHADAPKWPAPERLQSGPLASYGYRNEVVLPVLLSPAPGWKPGAPAHLGATVSWLACKDSCIPEKARLEWDLPAVPSEQDAALVGRFLARTPEAYPFTVVRARRSAGRLELTLGPVAGSGEFFPDEEELIEPGVPPEVRRSGPDAVWSAPLGAAGRALSGGAHVTGVWIEGQARPRRVDAVFETS